VNPLALGTFLDQVRTLLTASPVAPPQEAVKVEAPRKRRSRKKAPEDGCASLPLELANNNEPASQTPS
jgi:hypothetical protein